MNSSIRICSFALWIPQYIHCLRRVGDVPAGPLSTAPVLTIDWDGILDTCRCRGRIDRDKPVDYDLRDGSIMLPSHIFDHQLNSRGRHAINAPLTGSCDASRIRFMLGAPSAAQARQSHRSSRRVTCDIDLNACTHVSGGWTRYAAACHSKITNVVTLTPCYRPLVSTRHVRMWLCKSLEFSVWLCKTPLQVYSFDCGRRNAP